MHFDFKNDVNELLKILKLALCHDMTPRGYGKKMIMFRESFHADCLQTGPSLRKKLGF